MGKTKEVYCGVHGYVALTPLAQRFTDTREFQRLGFIKQLGASTFVFACADHTRKAHSLGVYHLARRLATLLRARHPQLVSERDIELVGLAGLLHDLGHACFSHLYDEAVALHGPSTSPRATHEARSVALVRRLVRRYAVPLSTDEVDVVCRVIWGGDDWRTDVVSGVVDVDRMDYLCRDSLNTGVVTPFRAHAVDHILRHASIVDGRLAFHPKVRPDVEDMLRARWFLHERVYQHRVCVAIECMLLDVLALVHASGWRVLDVDDEDTFLALHDGLLVGLQRDPRTPPAAAALLDRVWKRDFYQEAYCEEFDGDDVDVDALRALASTHDAVVRARWLGMGTGAQHPLQRVRFVPGARPSTPRPAEGPHRRYRVTVVAKHRDGCAAARAAAVDWCAAQSRSASPPKRSRTSSW